MEEKYKKLEKQYDDLQNENVMLLEKNEEARDILNAVKIMIGKINL